jgi:hypothetical protein
MLLLWLCDDEYDSRMIDRVIVAMLSTAVVLVRVTASGIAISATSRWRLRELDVLSDLVGPVVRSGQGLEGSDDELGGTRDWCIPDNRIQ